MTNIAKELEEIIEIYRNDFSDLDEQITSFRIDQDKWTLKEIIGHLVDSAYTWDGDVIVAAGNLQRKEVVE